jgi:hypothetical protein
VPKGKVLIMKVLELACQLFIPSAGIKIGIVEKRD